MDTNTLLLIVLVVAAGGIRTPALLAASGIGNDALGRYLYDHPLAYGQLVLKGEPFAGDPKERKTAPKEEDTPPEADPTKKGEKAD